MHLLFLPRWYPGQADPQNGVFIRKHAQAVALYHKVTVLMPEGRSNLPGESRMVRQQGNLAEWVYYYPLSRLPFLGRILNALRFVRILFIAIRDYRREYGTPDLMHVHMMSRNAVPAWWYQWRLGIPYLITEHATYYLGETYAQLHPLRQWMRRWLFQKAKAVTVVSPSLQTALKTRNLREDSQIVPNVVEKRDSPASMPVLEGQSDTVKILNVSDFHDRKKNISGLLRAAQQLLQQGMVFELHIIGGGPDWEAIQQLHTQLFGKGDSPVYFYGQKDNPFVLQAMQEMDFYVCPSHVETFSVTTAEALAAGKPVVCTRCGGPEYFVENSCGRVIPKDDLEALTRALEEMLSTYQTYSTKEIQAVAQQFTSQQIGAIFDQLYRAIRQ